MKISILNILFYSLIPALCMLVGGLIASLYQPKARLTSAMQHFAAGVVFAAVAKELLPKLGAENEPVVLTVGFIVGVLSMLLLKLFSETLNENSTASKGISWGLITAVGVDLFIDGVLIGIAFLAGEQGGILIAIALAIEILFLGLSATASLGARGVSIKIRLILLCILALLIPAGSLSGASLLSQLPSYYTEGLLAFGVAALLYLVTEELLTEAHETEDTPYITASFFIGFLLILLLENLAK
ncbi:hypothetical protein E3983_13240 [Legionella israelensis]|uniref:Integral membrane protein n=1 Tax=Legionella israelensis TaxID=454 RepID=A0A0W0WJS9_9GAMM|nr:hypothetical protein [Legionella israelensis]KTD32586.1 integral membrane protein [Legionella israelensis]QBR85228.1 hypothetical protein E3983_13240 [Legionella israelensis]QBS09869.1 hypothetical protein E4T55_08345 [Legionella israelensis]QDP71332.1 hypothetical protein FOG18_01430 [Legionella israelensis]SCY18091.1 zinc transporter, ZIP family [Legionella israelensis DSM 19235]